MRLTSEDITSYRERGYLLQPQLLSETEVESLRAALPPAIESRPEATLANQGDGSVRLVFGVHQSAAPFTRTTRLPRLLGPAMHLLGGEVYVHQTKVTLNTRQDGEGWPWHQDYAFWRRRDRIPTARVLSAAVFLDRVSEVNGPLFIVPGSHRGELFETDDGLLDRDRLAEVCRTHGIDVPLGPAGSVLFFDGKVVHGSPDNISPFARRILYITYNSVGNAPVADGEAPPEYMAARHHDPLVPLQDSALVTPAD